MEDESVERRRGAETSRRKARYKDQSGVPDEKPRRPAKPPRPWTADEMLHAWGRVSSSAAKSGGLGSPGGVANDLPDEDQAASFIKRVPGFSKAEPVLWHFYVKCQPLETFRVTDPGEWLQGALLRRGWDEWLHIRPVCNIPVIVHQEFREMLEALLKMAPWFPLPPTSDRDDEILDTHIEDKHGNVRTGIGKDFRKKSGGA